MGLPTNIPLIHRDHDGNATAPRSADWWMEVDTPPRDFKPAHITLVHKGTEYLIWKCGTNKRGFSEDEHITDAAKDLDTMARALARQIPLLERVGERTRGALQDGVDPHRDPRTGKLPSDIEAVIRDRNQASRDAWLALRPAINQSRAALTTKHIEVWAHHIMEGGNGMDLLPVM